MKLNFFILTFIGWSTMLALSAMAFPASGTFQKQEKVVMRMIGHQMLLQAGDSTSRVLPVLSQNNSYLIRFEKEFSFDPGVFEKIVEETILKSTIPQHYVAEVLNCETEDVVYSFEKGGRSEALNLCAGRINPVGCYQVLFTILPGPWPPELAYSVPLKPTSDGTDNPKTGDNKAIVLAALFLFAVLILFQLLRKKKNAFKDGKIQIGSYYFDKKNMELYFGDNKSELTSKESDLLYMLYSSANDTLEREQIFKQVWGNESEYIGRTLDVFISKLRKKLESDSSVKIVNVRGVGYKMVLNS